MMSMGLYLRPIKYQGLRLQDNNKRIIPFPCGLKKGEKFDNYNFQITDCCIFRFNMINHD